MNIRVNKPMLQLLGGDPEFYEPSSFTIRAALVNQLSRPLKEVQGCVVPIEFPHSSIWGNSRPRIDMIDDETGFECSWSKTYLGEFLPTSVTLEERARMSLDCAFVLRSALHTSLLSGSFRIIISAQLPDPDLDVTPDCNIRFHRRRPAQLFIVEDIDSYTHEALAVADFD